MSSNTFVEMDRKYNTRVRGKHGSKDLLISARGHQIGAELRPSQECQFSYMTDNDCSCGTRIPTEISDLLLVVRTGY